MPPTLALFSKKIIKAMKAGVYFPPATPTGGATTAASGWQAESWNLWECVPELNFPTTFISHQVMRLGWNVEIDNSEQSEAAAEQITDRVTAGMGPEEAARLISLNLQVAAEGWYVEEEDGNFQVYSVVTPGIAKIVEDTKKAGRIVFKFIDSSPINPKKGNASIKSVLDPARELKTLSDLSSAQSWSRLSQAGIVVISRSLGQDIEGDPFGEGFVRSMEVAIRDPRSPAALAPIKIETDLNPEQLKDAIHHVTFDRPFDDKIPDKIKTAQGRVALGLDLPPELIFGLGDTSHWNAWAITDQAYTGHIEPQGKVIGDVFAHVAQMLEERESNLSRIYAFIPDPSSLLARKSTVRDAFDGLEHGAVGFKFVREAMGATDDDAPTPEELEVIKVLYGKNREALVEENPGPPTTEDTAREGVGAVVSGAAEAKQIAEIVQKVYLGVVNGVVTAEEARFLLRAAGWTELPESIPQAIAASLGFISDHAGLGPLLQLSADVARAKVGAKLRTEARGTPAAKKIEGIPNQDVAAVLGHEVCSGLTDLDVVILDGLSHFAGWWKSNAPSDLSSTTACFLIGEWISNTLYMKSAELSEEAVPLGLVRDLSTGMADPRLMGTALESSMGSEIDAEDDTTNELILEAV